MTNIHRRNKGNMTRSFYSLWTVFLHLREKCDQTTFIERKLIDLKCLEVNNLWECLLLDNRSVRQNNSKSTPTALPESFTNDRHRESRSILVKDKSIDFQFKTFCFCSIFLLETISPSNIETFVIELLSPYKHVFQNYGSYEQELLKSELELVKLVSYSCIARKGTRWLSV